jgi:outer membrane protein OmpA-like peptidoglycan-associated protein
VGELADSPLVIYNADGSTRAIPVHYALVLHPGASVVLFDRVRVGLDVPIAAFQDGQTGVVSGVTYQGVTSGGAGDLRLGADVRIFGQYGDAFRLAAGTQFFVPTGNRSTYLGDGSLRVIIPRALVAGDIDWFSYAAQVGFNYRGLTDSFGGSGLGSEFVFGVSAGVRALERNLLVGPELYGSSVVTNGAAFSKVNTPVEVMLGAHYLVASTVRIGAGVAPGLTKGYGEPAVRYVLSVEWAPAPEAPPPPDRDHDGILDADDACPDVPGVKTDDPKTNGCPPDLDRDKDGIQNDVDACPDTPGPKNKDPKKNGCPAAAIVGKQIVILEQVKFATGSATILPASDAVLTAVLDVLTQHPDIQHLRIEGHTDNVGAVAMNKALSTRRAASVVAWLVKHGVDAPRLASQGFGMERPIDSNTTPEGRQNNRRVEFHIVDAASK